MNAVVESGIGQRRHRRLVDRALQGQLIWQLLAFEAILFAVAMAFVYFRLEAVIDAQLYRVHRGPLAGDNNLPPVLSAVLAALPWILLPNIIVITLIARHWRDRVKEVVEPLDELFQAAASLDLGRRPLRSDAHDVLARAELWHEAQRTRCTALRNVTEQLTALSQSDAGEDRDLEVLREKLQQMQRLTR
jgi:hypothetical protein